MRLRTALLFTAAIGLVSTSTTGVVFAAAPKPKPLCKLIVDAEGDGRSVAVNAISSPSLDIVSGDVATGKKNIVGVLRLKTTDTSDLAPKLGARWVLLFTVSGTKYTLTRSLSSGTNGQFTWGMTAGGENVDVSKIAPPKVDATSITWTVPRSTVSGLKKSKQKLDELAGSTKVGGTNADSAPSDKFYPDLHPSCVKAS